MRDYQRHYMRSSPNYYQAAVVGYGFMGAQHARALRFLGRVGGIPLLGSIVDVSEERRNRAAKNMAGTALVCESIESLILTGAPSVAFLATPPAFRLDTARTLSRAGVALYCEKPLGLTLAQARDLVTCTQDAGVPAVCGMVLRFTGLMNLLQSLLQERAVGTVVSVSLKATSGFPDSRHHVFPASQRLAAHRGILWEEGIHDLDTLLSLFGPLAVLDAELTYTDDGGQHEHAVRAQFTSSAIPSMEYECSWHRTNPSAPSRVLHIIGTDGDIRADFFVEGTVTLTRKGEPPQRWGRATLRRRAVQMLGAPSELCEPAVPYSTLAIWHFLQTLSGSMPPLIDASVESALPAHALAEEVYLRAGLSI